MLGDAQPQTASRPAEVTRSVSTDIAPPPNAYSACISLETDFNQPLGTLLAAATSTRMPYNTMTIGVSTTHDAELAQDKAQVAACLEEQHRIAMYATAPTRLPPWATVAPRSVSGAANGAQHNHAAAETPMTLIAWIILGLIAGFVASKIINRRGEGVVVDVLLGIVGAVVGGWLFHEFGMSGVTGLNLNSVVVATVGAVVVLLVYHVVFRRYGLRGH